MDWLYLLHHTLCGAIAAVGFGVLFNISFRSLPWAAAAGALALLVRTICMNYHWSLEAASFAAALAVGFAVQVLQKKTDISVTALDVAGCIPMIPGSFAAKAILGLFALTAPNPSGASETLLTAVEYTLRVMFTIGAIGTGLAVPNLLLRMKVSKQS
ncbi:MAG TPA: threonine/serine exporter family protein [Candidatus Paceibacterota bacterium]|nr:threonine/serine exporter family protein [Candidatus Paceibacterota bacterium]